MRHFVHKLKKWWASPGPADFLLVEWDECEVRVRALDPAAGEWNQQFTWSAITRVCFCDGGLSMSDLVFLELKGVAKPAVVSTEARGGSEFVAELWKRGLFPRAVFDQAMTSTDGGTYCWPVDTD